MLDQLLQLDENIFLALNSIRSPFFDRVLFMFSGRFAWALMYGTMLYALFKGFRNWKTALTWTLVTILAIVLADQICASVLRPYFERLRPAHPENPLSQFVNIVNDYRGGRYGFPSCHAANSFALATVTSLIWRGSRIRWFLFIWAALNSYSRVYLGVHYPGDLLTGAILGCIFGAIAYAPGYFITRKIAGGNREQMLPISRSASLGRLRFHYRNIDIAIIIGIATTLEIILIAMK